MKEIRQHIEQIDVELEGTKETAFRIELLKAKSTALLALAETQERVIRLANFKDNSKGIESTFKIEGYGFRN